MWISSVGGVPGAALPPLRGGGSRPSPPFPPSRPVPAGGGGSLLVRFACVFFVLSWGRFCPLRGCGLPVFFVSCWWVVSLAPAVVYARSPSRFCLVRPFGGWVLRGVRFPARGSCLCSPSPGVCCCVRVVLFVWLLRRCGCCLPCLRAGGFCVPRCCVPGGVRGGVVRVAVLRPGAFGRCWPVPALVLVSAGPLPAFVCAWSWLVFVRFRVVVFACVGCGFGRSCACLAACCCAVPVGVWCFPWGGVVVCSCRVLLRPGSVLSFLVAFRHGS